MPTNIEALIRKAYIQWKHKGALSAKLHPDEEDLVSFLEGKLGEGDYNKLRLHILSCDICARAISVNLGLQEDQIKVMPEELVYSLKDMLLSQDKSRGLDIFLKHNAIDGRFNREPID